MTRKIFCLLLIGGIAAATVLSGQNTFKKKFNGASFPFCLDQAPDGSFWVGNLFQGRLAHLSATGDLLPSFNIQIVGSGDPSGFWDIERAADNGFWALPRRHTASSNDDVQAIRVGPSGQILWQHTILSGSESGGFRKYLSADATDHVWIASDLPISINADLRAYRMDPSGNMVWTRDYNLTFRTYLYQIDGLSDGSALMGGTYADGSSSGFLIKIDTKGDVIWSNQYKGISLRNFVELPGGDLLLVGDDSQNRWYMLTRTSSTGEVIWSKKWDKVLDVLGEVSTMVARPDGSILIADNADTDILCVSPNGDFLWGKNYDPCYSDAIPDLISTLDGGIAFVTGNKAFVKTDATGNIEDCPTFDINLSFSSANVSHSNLFVSTSDAPMPPQQVLLEILPDSPTISDFCQSPLPTTDILLNTDTLCVGQRLTASSAGPNSPDTYQWNFSSGTPYNGSTSTVSNILFSGPGQHLITLQTAFGRCLDTLETLVTVIAPNTELDLGPDTLICGPIPLVIDAKTQGTNLTYLWSDGLTSAQRTITQPGTYLVSVTEGFCTISDSISVRFAEKPTNTFSDTTLCASVPLLLTTDQPADADIYWNGLLGGPQFIFADSGWVVRVVDYGAGCQFFDSIFVQRINCSGDFTYYAPNAFQPMGENADNTAFQIFPLDAEVMVLQVYDRWGSLVSENSGASPVWDGQNRGTISASGVYVWQALLSRAGQEKWLSGEVTLIR